LRAAAAQQASIASITPSSSHKNDGKIECTVVGGLRGSMGSFEWWCARYGQGGGRT